MNVSQLDFDLTLKVFEDTVNYIDRTIKDSIPGHRQHERLVKILSKTNIFVITNVGFYEQFWDKYISGDSELLHFLLAESVSLSINVLSDSRRKLLVDHIATSLSLHVPKSSKRSMIDRDERDRLPTLDLTKEILEANFWLVYVVAYYFTLQKV